MTQAPECGGGMKGRGQAGGWPAGYPSPFLVLVSMLFCVIVSADTLADVLANTKP